MAAVTYLSQKRPIIATIVTLVAVVIMSCLGVWQWQRGEAKQERLASLEMRTKQAPMRVSEVAAYQGDIRDLPIGVYGKLQTSKVFLLDNRIFKGQVGYEVIAPLDVNGQALLINLGWIAAKQTRDALPVIALTDEENEFTGTVYVPGVNPLVRETAVVDGVWPKVLQAIDFDNMGTHLGQTPLPFVLQLDPRHPEGFARDWKPVVMPPEKHYGYAIQWFGLAIAALAIYVFAVRKQAKDED